MTSMASAATIQELAKFLSEGQAAKVYAIFDNPPIVFACRVNQAFATHDKVFEFDFDGVTTGAYTDVVPGMAVLLGSAAGLSDKGITFARKAPTSSKFYNGETSEVDWENDLFATVLQDFGLWEEHLLILSDGTVLMKHEVAYTDQHSNLNPVPILGCDRIDKLDGASVTVNFDASNSYAPGSSVASHAFTCPGATITGASTATPSMEIDTVGRYLVTYTVTAANGKSTTTYRTIQIWDDDNPPANVTVTSVSGDKERGGYEFKLTVDESSATVRKRTKVILFAEEWYGGALGSIGPIDGAENIIAIGWLDSEGLVSDEDGGSVRFTVQGPAYWFKKMYNFIALGLESVTGAPTAWTQMQNLTVDLALWHFLIWRTTAANCMDIFLTDDTRQALELTATAGSIWQQLSVTAQNTIVAAPCCDAYGRLFIEVDTALLPVADRGSIPTVISLNHDNWETIDIEYITTPPASQVILSGVAVSSGQGAAYFSLAPGHIPMKTGDPVTMEQLLLSSQAQSNELAGSILEKENCPYRFTINNLLANNRLIGICPRQRIYLTIAADDTPRGIAYAGYALVRSITLEHDAESGAWSISLTADAETQANLYCNGDIPAADPADPPIVFPPFPPLPPLPKTPPLPALPVTGTVTPKNILVILVPGYGVYYTNFLDGFYNWISINNCFLPADCTTFYRLEVNAFGRAFLLTSGLKFFEIKIGSNLPTMLGSGWFSNNYGLTAMGIDPLVDGKAMVCGSGTNQGIYERSVGYWSTTLASGIVSLTYEWDFRVNGQGEGPPEGAGNIWAYDNRWYHAGYWAASGQRQRFVRLPTVLGSYEYDSGWLGYSNHYAYTHARKADIQYWQPSDTIIKKTGLGQVDTNIIGVTTAGGYDQIVCDPTGQYVWIIDKDVITSVQTIKKSGDFGATWAAVTHPVGTISQACLLNMGDSLKWAISYIDVTASLPDIERKIYRTIDAGATWIDCTGNLSTHVPSGNVVIGAVRYA